MLLYIQYREPNCRPFELRIEDPTRLMEEAKEDMFNPEPDISLPWCLSFR